MIIDPTTDTENDVCQLCGTSAQLGDDWPMPGDADAGSTIANTMIQMTVSTRKEEGYPNEMTTSFTICATCFQSKLIPWMKSQGAEPVVQDV